MYNPWMMNPTMGGGMNYWNPQRMQMAQPMGMYNATAGAQPEGGADRPGYEWRASRREGMEQRGNVQDKLGRAQERLGLMQERFKGASSRQQQAMQPRIDNMQNRIDRWQGQLDEGQGADRLGMGWRKERRQAKNAGTYDPNAPQSQGGAEPAMWQGGMMPGMGGMGFGGMGWGGFGGGMPQAMPRGTSTMWQNLAGPNGSGPGGVDSMQQTGPTPVAPYNPTAAPQSQGGWNPAWGTPTDQFGNATTVEAYNKRLADVAQATNTAKQFNQAGRLPTLGVDVFQNMMSPTDFQTPFGHLVPASGGNSNIYKKNGGGEDTLYHFDPTQGWKSMTADEYRGYGNYNYQSPLQSEDMARRAGAMSASNYW